MTSTARRLISCTGCCAPTTPTAPRIRSSTARGRPTPQSSSAARGRQAGSTRIRISCWSESLHLRRCSQIFGRSRPGPIRNRSASVCPPSSPPPDSAKRRRSKCSSSLPKSRPTPSSMAVASKKSASDRRVADSSARSSTAAPGFDDHAAGYLAPREGVGSGLWVARQLTWRIEFFQSPRGFTARIWL